MAITLIILQFYINVYRMIILIVLMIQNQTVVIHQQIRFAQFKMLKIIAKQVIILIVPAWGQEYITHMMGSMLAHCFLYNSKFKGANAFLQTVYSVIRAMGLIAIQ